MDKVLRSRSETVCPVWIVAPLRMSASPGLSRIDTWFGSGSFLFQLGVYGTPWSFMDCGKSTSCSNGVRQRWWVPGMSSWHSSSASARNMLTPFRSVSALALLARISSQRIFSTSSE